MDPGAPLLQLQIGQILARDYRVVRPLAAGGMGSVYFVEQLSTGKQRALKVMHPQYARDEESRARFAQEARAGARIKSEHVVEVVAAGVDDETGIPWIAMELLEGEELSLRVRRTGRLPPGEVLELFRQLGHGLGEAHRLGLVHRDLKPENLFIAVARRDNAPFTLKILDFGVAKLVQETQTSVQTEGTRPVGTPRWMAPEQSEEKSHITPATDVWALGLIAFYLLTGRYYWKAANLGGSLTTLLRELVLDPIENASSRAASIGLDRALPPGFDDWFNRCVVRDPHARFPDADAAMRALVPLLEHAPIWETAPAPGRPPTAPVLTRVGPARVPDAGDDATMRHALPKNSKPDDSAGSEATMRHALPKPQAGAAPAFAAQPLEAASPLRARSLASGQDAAAGIDLEAALAQQSASRAPIIAAPTPAAPTPTAPTASSAPSTLTPAPASATAATAPLAPSHAAASRSRALRFAAIGAAIIALAAVAIVARNRSRADVATGPNPASYGQPLFANSPLIAPPPPTTPVTPATDTTSFPILFESIPSGADVYEGDTKLGTTPLQLTLDNAPLMAAPRHYRIIKEGYQPYSLVQGPSHEAVKLLATLGPESHEETHATPKPPKKHRETGEPEEPELRLQR